MANFNDQVNNYIGRYFAHRPLEIRRVDTMKAFERAISGWMNDYFNPASSEYKSKEKLASMDSVFQDGQFDEMDECDIHCSLYILYKEEHRVQKLAGRCFSWDNMEEAFIGIKGEELRLEKGRYLSNRNGFCIPRFDAMQAAVLITDYEVVAYGDSYIEADDMDEDLVHYNVYVGYGLVADIHIDTKEFDRFFGLKENFPKQYDEIFGQAKVPYADPFDAQVESDEQDETEAAQIVAEAAQIVAENATESTNEKETTECTTCIKLSKENGDDTYHRNLFGCEFFDTRECQRDIDRVKIGVENVISLMHDALRKLDEAIDDVGRHTELTDNAQLLLRKSELLIDDAMASARAAINDTAEVFWKACKYRIKGA